MEEVRKERILVTVKTYPTLSEKYGETVCTAGLREDGSWVRLYPMPFRRLRDVERYKKYDWLDCSMIRNTKDPRPETFRPLQQEALKVVGHMDTRDQWRERRQILLDQARVWTRLGDLVSAAKANQASLAVFKPARIVNFSWEAEEEREWDPRKVRRMRDAADQHDLFDHNAWRETFRVIPKLPYKFFYKFEDSEGHASRLRVLDWEVGALFRNCRRRAGNSLAGEPESLAKVKEKYLNRLTTTDLHFFLGTTREWQFRAPNPWMIVGVAPIPAEDQLHLFTGQGK